MQKLLSTKKMSLSPRFEPIKRRCDNNKQIPNKREKNDTENLDDINFIKACEQVLKNVHEDTLNRFTAKGNYLRYCEQTNLNSLKEKKPMPPHLEIAIHIEITSNKWLEALQVCFLSITPTQFLSLKVVKDIIEIMLNAHEDQLSDNHMTYLIEKCQQVLSLNLRMHPPCSSELQKYYKNIFKSPMDSREKTLTNRKAYGHANGIFNYCINRLQDELSSESQDGPLFNKEIVMPAEVKQTVQQLHWVQSRFQIYETLNRKDRIDRLMAVMDSMAEFFRFDLARQNSQQLSRKEILVIKELLPPFTETNVMNDTCLQIMKIFIYFVHLNYPEKYIKTMSVWINIVAELLHESKKPAINDICDSYEPGQACLIFADKFYEIMVDLPPESIIKIIERITPAPVKYSIGIQHVKKLLGINDELTIIKILSDFMKNSQWNAFPETTTEIKAEGKELPDITSDNILKQLAMMCKNHKKSCCNNNVVYLKIETNESVFVNDRHYVMKALYITFRAYLDNYKIHRLQKTYDSLQLNNEYNVDQLKDFKKQLGDKYGVTKNAIQKFITMYKNIYIQLKEYFSIIKSLKLKNELPETFCIFEKIIDFNEL